MQRGRIPLLSTLLLFVSAAVFADATSSALTGTVTSEGKPLAGATISVSSSALIATRTSTSGANGDYNFPALPPGLYDVSFEREGMQTRNRRAKLDLAQTSRLDADLKPSAVAETVTSTAIKQTVLETPQVSTNLDAALIEQLATGRGIRDRAALAPGVQTSPGGELVINGAPPDDNLDLADGAAFTRDPAIEEAIQETAVLTGALSAEYGHFTGGVISTITKSGGNEFSGSLRDNLTSDKWIAKRPGERRRHGDKLSHVFEATLGGPVAAGRLWFFAAARDGKSRSSDETAPHEMTITDERRYEGKLTGNVAASHTVVASFLDARGTQTGTSIVAIPAKLRAGHYTGVIGDNLVVEALYGRSDGWKRDRNETAKASYFASTTNYGSHEIVAGYDRWKTHASFVNDAWHLSPHWSFNLGARYDSGVSPRLGVIYDLAGDGHQRASVTYGRYTPDIDSHRLASMNELTASYGMNIGGNGFVRGDFIHRTWSNRIDRTWDGAQLQVAYRLLGFVTAGGNYTRARTGALNVWLQLAPPMPSGALGLSVLERDRSTNFDATYAIPVSRVSLFVKADLLNAFNDDRDTTPRTSRVAMGLRF